MDHNPQGLALRTEFSTDTVLASTTPTDKASAWHLTTIQSICLWLTFGSPSRSVRRKVLNHNPALVGKTSKWGTRMLVNHMHGNSVLIGIAVLSPSLVAILSLHYKH